MPPNVIAQTLPGGTYRSPVGNWEWRARTSLLGGASRRVEQRRWAEANRHNRGSLVAGSGGHGEGACVESRVNGTVLRRMVTTAGRWF